eukprot:829521-Amphidinium_carterae.1
MKSGDWPSAYLNSASSISSGSASSLTAPCWRVKETHSLAPPQGPSDCERITASQSNAMLLGSQPRPMLASLVKAHHQDSAYSLPLTTTIALREDYNCIYQNLTSVLFTPIFPCLEKQGTVVVTIQEARQIADYHRFVIRMSAFVLGRRKHKPKTEKLAHFL